jgi:predicted dehydrogenase
MNPNESDAFGFNRRDFLKSGSFATLMTMMGAVELVADEPAKTAAASASGAKVKIAVIGQGVWGREIVHTLLGDDLKDLVELVAICDTYAPILRRAAAAAPGAAQVPDYKALLENKDISAVVVATPTHKHKEIVLAALKAGKHVYCEAPFANTIEDAREIALAAKANPQRCFQAGLQVRCDPERRFLLPFIRAGNIGKPIMARAQWHKKSSWRTASASPEQEQALNWRLSKETSLGLIGEIGIHQLDQASAFLNRHPVAITGFGSIAFWNKDNAEAPDERDVPDTVQAVIEYPGGVRLSYDATLANSFDAAYEIYYGGYAAVILREGKAWMIKETDSPLFDWEVYAPKEKEKFHEATGIALIAGASKSSVAAPAGSKPKEELSYTQSVLTKAFSAFLKRCAAIDDFVRDFGSDGKVEQKDLQENLTQAHLDPAPGFLEGFQATVTAIKANEAINAGGRLVIKPEWYELG